VDCKIGQLTAAQWMSSSDAGGCCPLLFVIALFATRSWGLRSVLLDYVHTRSMPDQLAALW